MVIDILFLLLDCIWCSLSVDFFLFANCRFYQVGGLQCSEIKDICSHYYHAKSSKGLSEAELFMLWAEVLAHGD